MNFWFRLVIYMGIVVAAGASVLITITVVELALAFAPYGVIVLISFILALLLAAYTDPLNFRA